jgi:hypothetical protein
MRARAGYGGCKTDSSQVRRKGDAIAVFRAENFEPVGRYGVGKWYTSVSFTDPDDIYV